VAAALDTCRWRRRHDPVADHPPLAVNVAEEQLQRLRPLLQAGLQPLPVLVRHDPRDEVDGERAGLAVDHEGDVALGLVPVARALELLQSPAAEPVEHRDDLARGRSGRTGLRHRLVSGDVRVVGKHRVGLRCSPVYRAHVVDRRGLGYQQVDDVGQLGAPAVGISLLAAGGAAQQHVGCELGDRLPVTFGLEVGPQVVHQAAHDFLGRDGQPVAQVDEVSFQPGAGGPPDCCSQELGRQDVEGPAGKSVGTRPPDQRPEQTGDQDDVIDPGAGIGEP